MRVLMIATLAAAGLTATGAGAQPALQLRNAMVRVTVAPEARPDVAVTVLRANPRLPLRVSRVGDRVVVDGGLIWPGVNCRTVRGRPGAASFGRGAFTMDELPQILVRAPRDVRVDAGGAVFGDIGAGQSVDLDGHGCGGWTLADQAGPLRIRVSGASDVRAGASASAEVRIAGSGNVTLGPVRGGLDGVISGSGNLAAAAVNGPLRARVAGSGDVKVAGGAASDMIVAVAGSGDVRFGGVAQTLTANVSGSGDVSVAHVSGRVVRHVAGSGDVTVGR